MEEPFKAKIEINSIKKEISFTYRAYYREEDNGMVSWNIPSCNISFSSANMEIGKKKVGVMGKIFLKYWVENSKKNEFLLELHSLGFRLKGMHDLQMYRLLKNINKKPTNLTFSKDVKPSESNGQSGSIIQENKLATQF
jgi:hypothetical protein